MLPLTVFFSFFFPDFLRRFLSLGALFGLVELVGLVGLIFSLRGPFVSLIIPRIKIYLQDLFSFRILLIKMSTPLNLSLGLSLINCTD